MINVFHKIQSNYAHLKTTPITPNIASVAHYNANVVYLDPCFFKLTLVSYVQNWEYGLISYSYIHIKQGSMSKAFDGKRTSNLSYHIMEFKDA